MRVKALLLSIFVLGLVPAQAEDAGVQQQLEGFNLNGYNDSGRKTWEVNGDKADISEDKIKVTNVDANFYGNEKANLTSKTGTINKTTGEVHLEDDVVITSECGTKMTTESLDWNRNQNLISTKDAVEITDKQGVVTGEGLTARSDLKQASINKDVKAVINTNTKGDVKNAQKVTITCDGPMTMDQQKFHAVFIDNVVALEEATGRELYADRMDVWFDDKNKKIKKVICKGNVKAVQGGNATYAEEMVYTGDDQQLIMTGRPKIVFDTGSSNGEGMFKGLSE